MGFEIKKATREELKARVALIGVSGSGKTYDALIFAAGLARRPDGTRGRVIVIDTENRSASKYADDHALGVEFDVLELDTFAPDTYVEAIRACEAAGAASIVIDSLSHAWMGKDGALEMVDKAAARSQSRNSFDAWRSVTPKHNALVDALLRCKAHLIVTMRAKTEYVVEETASGKKVPRKIGLQPVQRDGLEYEFDVVAEVNGDHQIVVTKSRCSALADQVIDKADVRKTAVTLRSWLNGTARRDDQPKDAAPVDAPAAPPPLADLGIEARNDARPALAPTRTALAAFGDDLTLAIGLRAVGACWQMHSRALHAEGEADDAAQSLADALHARGYDLVASEQHALCTGTWPEALCTYLDGLARQATADAAREHYLASKATLEALGDPHVTVGKRNTGRAVMRLRKCDAAAAKAFLAPAAMTPPEEPQPPTDGSGEHATAAAETPPALEALYARIAEIELPGEAVAVWMKHRTELAAFPAADREAVWTALCKRAGDVGKMRNAKVWLKKAIAEEDARRTAEAAS